MKRIGLIQLVLLLLFFTSANAQDEITVPVKEGSFLVKDIKLRGVEENSDQLWLEGNVVNNTNKDWSDVYFQLYLFDKQGNKLKDDLGHESFTFPIHDSKRGDTTPILPGADVYGIARKKIEELKVYFKSGTYVTKYFFTMVKPTANDSLLFDSTAIKIQFSVSPERIGFVLQNKSDNPVAIDWNKLSYIDVSGESHRVIHTEVRYIERDKPQTPTIVPPTAKVEDEIIPIGYIVYNRSWSIKPFFPRGPEAPSYKGKSFSIFMPLEIDGVIKNHLFTFTIKDVEY